MPNSSAGSAPARSLWDTLAEGVTDRLASVLAPYLPDRYYDRYGQLLAEELYDLQTLRDLPDATLESGMGSLVLRDASGAAIRPMDLLAQSAHVLLLGAVGSGKTTLLRYLSWRLLAQPDESFVQWATYRHFREGVRELRPLYVDLRGQEGDLVAAIENALGRFGFRLPLDYALTQLDAGRILLLLDHAEARGTGTMDQVGAFLSDHPSTLCIVSARSGTPTAMPSGWSRCTVDGLQPEATEGVASHALGQHSAGSRGILAARERCHSFERLSRNPLMLSAMCQQLRGQAVQGPRLADLLQGCLDCLAGEWLERSGVRSSLAHEEIRRCAESVAHGMLQRGDDVLPREVAEDLCAKGHPSGSVDGARVVDDLLASGLFFEGDGRGVAVLDPLLMSYLAARALVSANDVQEVVSCADDSRWHDTIALTCGLLDDPMPLLSALDEQPLSEAERALLLARGIAESRRVDRSLQNRVTDELFAVLEGDDESLWPDAAAAIAGMSRTRVRDHFTSLIRRTDAPDERRLAALAMGRLAAQWAVPSLGAAISDSEPEVRQQAAWALGFIPSAQVVHVLPRALRSPYEGVREAAAGALVRQAQSPELLETVVADLIGALDEDRESPDTVDLAEKTLARIGSTASEQLLTALGNRRLSSGQRSRVARALGLLGDDRALPILVDAILGLSAEEASGYVEAVAAIGAPAVAPLIQALEGRDMTTSLGIMEALVQIGAPAVDALIDAIAAPSPEVRRAAVHALTNIGEPAVAPLTVAMLRDNRFEVRRRALEILGSIGEADVGATLVAALDDDDRGVVVHAVRYLGMLRYEPATPALIGILHGERDGQPLRREAINSLSAIGSESAIDPLIDALDEVSLREAAASALVEFAEHAAMPLVRALHETTDADRRDSLWAIVEQIGQRGRPDEQNMLGLARVYGQLRNSGLNEEQILALVANLDWWTHGREIIASLQSAAQGADVANLRALSEFGPSLAWLSEVDDWLRPHVRDILWGLRDTVEDISLYHKISRRDGQRDALLSAIDRLEELGDLTQLTALPFEQRLLTAAIARWHALVLDTTKQLRGRAELLVSLLTPRLPVRDLRQRTMAVFKLFNEGDSPARNLSVSLRSVNMRNTGLTIIGDERPLDPLFIGEERQVEIPLIPGGAHTAELLFAARYDDDDRQRVTDRISCRIEFYEAPRTYTDIQQNPYIVGMPVRERDMFFGRQDVFDWVRENISGQYQEQPLLLYGERRMGKTSVLYQLQANPPTPNHLCILFDLQLYGYATTVGELLYELATSIATFLERHEMPISEPDWDAFEANPHRAFLAFADKLDESLGDKRIVIMMDEFGVLMDKVRQGVFDAGIFDYLRGITQRSRRFTFMFTGAYEVRRMQQDFDSILFNMPKVRKISYLTDVEATELIVEPVRGLITYHPLVIQRILNVTACHPYFIQYICQELVRLAQREKRNYIELTDVEAVIGEVVLDATGNIENSIYNYLSDEERLVLAALAHVTDEVRVFVLLGDIASMLERRHLGMSHEDILQALRALQGRDLVTETRIGQQLRYSFRMGLVRMWLRQNEMLLRLATQRG